MQMRAIIMVLRASVGALLLLPVDAVQAELDGAELIGTYPVEVTAHGDGCPALRRTQFEVRSVRGDRIDVVLDGVWAAGSLRGLLDGNAREFVFPLTDFDGIGPVRGQGFFDRRPDGIRAVIAINFPDSADCTAELEGVRRLASRAEPEVSVAGASPAPASLTEAGPTTVGPTGSTDCGQSLEPALKLRWENLGGAGGIGCPAASPKDVRSRTGAEAVMVSFAGRAGASVLLQRRGSASEALTVRGCFHDRYLENGGPTGRLGLPASAPERAGAAQQQHFEGGTIRQTPDGDCDVHLTTLGAERPIPFWAKLAAAILLGLLAGFMLRRVRERKRVSQAEGARR